MEIHFSQLKKPNRDVTLLAPIVQNRWLLALCELRDHGLNVAMFEGYRSLARQQYLYDQGRLSEGPIVTRARPYQSFHNYGLALDIAFKDDSAKWYWPDDKTQEGKQLWDRVAQIMLRFKFEPLSWERPHFQLSGGLPWNEAKRIHDSQGLIGLWDVVAKLY